MEENKNIQNEQAAETPAAEETAKGGFFANKKNVYIVAAIAAVAIVAGIVLAVVLGGKDAPIDNNDDETAGDVDPDNGEVDDKGDEEDETPALSYNNATELISQAYDSLPNTIHDGGTPDNTEDDLNKVIEIEEYKSYAFVGGFTLDAEEIPVQVEGAPGEFMLDGDMLDSMLGFPADKIDLIDDAASLMFAMNQNTFTLGAYHFVDGADLNELANAIEANIQGRMWMCGFPETVAVIKLPGNYLVSIFGHTIVDTFIDAFLAIEGAELLVKNPIA